MASLDPGMVGILDRGARLETETDGTATVMDDGDGRKYVAAWPGGDAARLAALAAGTPGSVLAPATTDHEGAHAFAAHHGLSPTGSAVLLSARTDTLDQEPDLPADGNLSAAALELYDVVEIPVFDHPVASGRIRVGDTTAVIGNVMSPGPGPADKLETVVIEALATEAAIHGVETLYTIIGPEKVPAYTAAGWTKAADILTF